MNYNNIPIISPEYFQLTPQETNKKVKALFVSYDKKYEPQIIYEDPDKILSIVFPEIKTHTIFFANNIHMYVSSTENYICSRPNQTATMLVREICMKKYGTVLPEIVFGNIVIFGTMNLSTNIVDNKNHSIPYHIIEEVIRIYDIIKKST